MPPLFRTSTRALTRRCFHPLPTFHLHKAPPFFTHRPRLVSDIPANKDTSYLPDDKWHFRGIYESLERSKEDKWGWVIYRTTYKDDAGWERFKSYVKKWSYADLSQPGIPRGLSPADWTFISDPVLDGASREQLRHHFREWRKTAWNAENPRKTETFPPKRGMSALNLRYITFIQVDEESLDSVLDGTGDDFDPAWVNLIRCDDDHDIGVQPPFRHSNDQWVVDEGWMMVAASSMRSEFYCTVGNLDDFWRVYYQAPPEVVWD